ncbi:MAG TPA: recombination protein O N-terminal domain-containing protein [Candidatus Paceibacterota bacterium]|jgi:recombinational DNA repair protein (RecF pathway)|nr:recombination protein O N-terminal domain-containing protein [Candidatus Paceibacterota bacterium]
MYQKYHTDALILGSREHGEADKVFALYTKDFGLVRARASAVRNESSKMRYAMQKYSLANVSLVKGKRGWRAAGAKALQIAIGDVHGVSTFARISELVLRLVHGEEKNEYLFAALAEAHEALMSKENSDVVGTIEIVCVARILFALGYISNEALSTALFTHTAYTGESLLEAETLKDKLLLSINKAIAETQL